MTLLSYMFDSGLPVFMYHIFCSDDKFIRLRHSSLQRAVAIAALARRRLAAGSFIYAALSGNVDTIISGDRHLLSLKTYNDVKIVSPSQFL
jgi:hypothetical protein